MVVNSTRLSSRRELVCFKTSQEWSSRKRFVRKLYWTTKSFRMMRGVRKRWRMNAKNGWQSNSVIKKRRNKLLWRLGSKHSKNWIKSSPINLKDSIRGHRLANRNWIRFRRSLEMFSQKLRLFLRELTHQSVMPIKMRHLIRQSLNQLLRRVRSLFWVTLRNWKRLEMPSAKPWELICKNELSKSRVKNPLSM